MTKQESQQAREFWIKNKANEYTDDQFWATETQEYDTDIHVIEHSAYAIVVKERDELKAEIAELKSFQADQQLRVEEAVNKANEQISRIAELEAELREQCRVNGIGQQRELRLEAELEAEKAESLRLFTIKVDQALETDWYKETKKLQQEYEDFRDKSFLEKRTLERKLAKAREICIDYNVDLKFFDDQLSALDAAIAETEGE